MDKKPITPEGQKKLREELDFIKNVKRQEIIDAISEVGNFLFILAIDPVLSLSGMITEFLTQ